MDIDVDNQVINYEGLKVLINIATNAPSSRSLMARNLSNLIFWLDKKRIISFSQSDQFLICRFLFLITIEREGSQIVNQNLFNENFENFKNFLSLEAEKDDETVECKIMIEILRIRYNQVKNGLFDQKE